MSSAGSRVTAARPVVLFVLGVNRSGTSALARVLSLCGGTLPPGLVGAMPDNPLGHWEPRAANFLNEAILQRHHSTMFDPTLRLQEEGAFGTAERSAWVEEIRSFFTSLPTAPLVVVVKDPRITVLSGLWFEGARSAGFDVMAAVTVRHPHEVIASVGRRSPASPELSGALWLKYNLLAERHTRDVPRVFVEYANLLQDWRREVKRISAALGIELDLGNDGAIDDFLKVDLRRQRYGGPASELFGSDWISTVYAELCALARDEPWDGSALDRVFGAYRASELDFRTVFEDFDRLRKLNRFYRPFMLKLNYKILAMAGRRSKTWI
ncbi:sulfotransferase family protein [Mycolicibacterium celeriflavum]|uniref:sulfotransferase family protein n=1 Tax=Mycolicibacterium celeriflavum TaxID=1249101 RepID=UPI003CEE7449